MFERIKNFSKKGAGAAWSILDGPKEVFGYKTKKTVELAKEEVSRRRQKIGERQSFWRAEIRQQAERSSKEGRNETFENAISRFGLREGDLLQIESSLRTKARLEVLVLWVGIVGVLSSLPFGSILGTLSGLVTFTFFFLVHARTIHRLTQVRQRKLFPMSSLFKRGTIMELLKYD